MIHFRTNGIPVMNYERYFVGVGADGNIAEAAPATGPTEGVGGVGCI